jgi:hypothetical protein
MDRFLQCVSRMVLAPTKFLEISNQMEVYSLATKTFGYDMIVQDKTTRMSIKLQFVSNLNVLPFYLLNNK